MCLLGNARAIRRGLGQSWTHHDFRSMGAHCRSAELSTSPPSQSGANHALRQRGCTDNQQRTERRLRLIRLETVNRPYGVQFRWLLRALLRECTYLPDRLARVWISDYVLRRFRARSPAFIEPQTESSLEEKALKSLAEARRMLSRLFRANRGESKSLMKVLFAAYGRTGRRRHELMACLRTPLEPHPNGSASGEGHGDQRPLDDNPRSQAIESHRLRWTPQMQALLVSQKRTRPAAWARPPMKKGLEPDIPALNTWLRPMPVSRIKNMTNEHKKYLLEKVLPPLPTAEWEELRDLALGKTFPSIPPLRQGALSTPEISPLELRVKLGTAPPPLSEKGNGRGLTHRVMQRLYEKLFSICPRLDWDVDKNAWNVTWGTETSGADGREKSVDAYT